MRPARRGPRRIEPGEAWERDLGHLLTLCGWTWQHTEPAYVPGRRAPITPMRGPGAGGYPDFTCWRPGRFLVAEAKAGAAVLTPDQRERLEQLDRAGVEAYRFRQGDLEAIRAVLQASARPADPPPELVPWRHRRSTRRTRPTLVQRGRG